mgnify:CR=1 FL=1
MKFNFEQRTCFIALIVLNCIVLQAQIKSAQHCTAFADGQGFQVGFSEDRLEPQMQKQNRSFKKTIPVGNSLF